MKSHRHRPQLRRLAIGLVAIGALVSASARVGRRVGHPAPRRHAPRNAAAKVGDTPADFPGASRAPGVALNAATGRRHAGRLPRRQPRARRRAADRSRSSGPSAPSCATSTRSCRSRSPAPRCSSCSWAPRSSSSACSWSAATRSGARTDLLKGREVGRVDAAHLLGQCGGQRVEVGDLDEVRRGRPAAARRCG